MNFGDPQLNETDIQKKEDEQKKQEEQKKQDGQEREELENVKKPLPTTYRQPK